MIKPDKTERFGASELDKLVGLLRLNLVYSFEVASYYGTLFVMLEITVEFKLEDELHGQWTYFIQRALELDYVVYDTIVENAKLGGYC